MNKATEHEFIDYQSPQYVMSCHGKRKASGGLIVSEYNTLIVETYFSNSAKHHLPCGKSNNVVVMYTVHSS